LAGLFWRLAAAAPDYAKIAWNGLVSPRLGYRDPVAIAQAVIIRERSVLLAVRRDLRGWELPGGHLKPGESPEAALAREIREETGHKVAIERHVGEYARTGFRPHTVSLFVCRITGGELRPSYETPVLRWFENDELPDTLFPWFREPIVDAFADSGEPVARSTYQGAAAVWAAFKIDLRMRWSGDRAGLPDSRGLS